MAVDLDAVTRQPCDHHYDMQHIVALHYGRGKPMYKPVCSKCGSRGNAISHRRIEAMGIDTAALPVVYSRDCRCERGCSQCSVMCQWPDCGSYEMVHLHHFLPKAIFGEELSARGQTAYYCQSHHDVWHRDVTPHIMYTAA